MYLIDKERYMSKLPEDELDKLELKLKEELFETSFEIIEAGIIAFRDAAEDYLDEFIEAEEYDEEYFNKYKNDLVYFAEIISEYGWGRLEL